MITDYELQAFVDDQLACEERLYVLEAARETPLLATRLAELQRLKALLQFAYRANAVCSICRHPQRHLMLAFKAGNVGLQG